LALKETYVRFIQDQLFEFGEIESKKMFGGLGFFKDGMMFGKIGGETFRLKVDEHNQADYHSRIWIYCPSNGYRRKSDWLALCS
jgi:DNA transformation protein